MGWSVVLDWSQLVGGLLWIGRYGLIAVNLLLVLGQLLWVGCCGLVVMG